MKQGTTIGLVKGESRSLNYSSHGLGFPGFGDVLMFYWVTGMENRMGKNMEHEMEAGVL